MGYAIGATLWALGCATGTLAQGAEWKALNDEMRSLQGLKDTSATERLKFLYQEKQEIWQQMNDAGRALFFGPPPGEPCKAGDEFISAISAEVPAPAHFVLLALRPVEVESLELNDTPHRRRRWRASESWKVERINP